MDMNITRPRAQRAMIETVRRLLALVALSLFFAALSLAQPSAFEGRKVALIQFDPRDQPVDAIELHDLLPLKTGAPLPPSSFAPASSASSPPAPTPISRSAPNPTRTASPLPSSRRTVGSSATSASMAKSPRLPPSPSSRTSPISTSASLTTTPSPKTPSPPKSACSNRTASISPSSTPPSPGTTSTSASPSTSTSAAAPAPTSPPPRSPETSNSTPVRSSPLCKLRRWFIHTWKPVTQSRVRQGLEGVRDLYLKDQRLAAKVTARFAQVRPRRRHGRSHRHHRFRAAHPCQLHRRQTLPGQNPEVHPHLRRALCR